MAVGSRGFSGQIPCERLLDTAFDRRRSRSAQMAKPRNIKTATMAPTTAATMKPGRTPDEPESSGDACDDGVEEDAATVVEVGTEPRVDAALVVAAVADELPDAWP